METTPSDRVQLIGQGQLVFPGCCALCGTGNSDGGYVDMGIYIDYHGQFYFCLICAQQITECIGGLSIEEVAFMREQMNDIASSLAEVTLERDTANERLAAYDNVFGNALNRIDSSSSDASDSVSKESEAFDYSVNEPVDDSESDESVATKSVKSTTSTRRVTTRNASSNASAGTGLSL